MKFYYYILIIGILFVSCWNKQKHDITRPVVPHYNFYGTTLDYVTGQPVPNATLKVTGQYMLYDIEFPTQIVQSDSMGNYSIDPIYPGTYTLSLNIDDCWLNEIRLQIDHEDRLMDIKIPETFITKEFINDPTSKYRYVNASYPCFAINSLTGVLPVKTVNNSTGEARYFFSKLSLKYGVGIFRSARETETDLSFTHQLSIGNGLYYTFKHPDSIKVFDQVQCTYLQSIATGINIKDIAFNIYDRTLYACTDSLLYSIDPDSYQPTEVAPLPLNGVSLFTFHRNILYLLKDDLLFRLDENLAIDKVMALVDKDYSNQYVSIYDLAFDGYDNLWVSIQ